MKYSNYLEHVKQEGIRAHFCCSIRRADHFELFSFGNSDPNADPDFINGGFINYFLSAKNRLRDFVSDFKEEADALIDEANSHAIITGESIEAPRISGSSIAEESYLPSPARIQTVIRLMYDAQVTKAEALCLAYSLQGYSCKLMAKEVDCSYRTIEKHMENIHYKLNAKTIREVVIKLLNEV